MATIGRKLAAWAHQLTYDQLGDRTIHEVKRRVLDSIGTALGAYHSTPANIAREVAMSITDTRAGTVWGTRHNTCPELAAFANGAMVRYLDFNDTYLGQHLRRGGRHAGRRQDRQGRHPRNGDRLRNPVPSV